MLFAPLTDQRRSERQWVATPVHILMGKSRIDGTTLNLSEHGMYLFTATNLPVGAEIELEFRPPNEKKLIQASAIIRRKVVYLYGIEFLNKRTQVSEDHLLLHPPGKTASEDGDHRS